MAFSSSPVLTISTTIIAFGIQGQGLWWDGSGTIQLANVDIFGNAGGDWVGPIAGQFGISGNLSLDPLFRRPAAGDYTLDGLSPCLPVNNPQGVQIGAHGWGCGTTTVVEAPLTDATRARRLGSYPNPFNPRTTITFRLDQPGRARLTLHDVTGRLIRCLADETFGDGDHRVFWDGRDGAGNAVASGTYLAVMRTATGEATHKLVLLR